MNYEDQLLWDCEACTNELRTLVEDIQYITKDEGVSGAVLFRAAGQSGWTFGLASRMDDCQIVGILTRRRRWNTPWST